MQTQKSILLSLLFAGILVIIICFFLDIAQFKETYPVEKECYVTFTAQIECEEMGKTQKTKCDGYCKSIKSTPIFGGFALGFSVLVFIIQLVTVWTENPQNQIKVKKPEKYMNQKSQRKQQDWCCCGKGFWKWLQFMLILFSFIFILTIPIMCLRKAENNVKVEDFPIILEFTGAISFAIVIWHIIKTPKQQIEALLS